MYFISYRSVIVLISAVWIIVRLLFCLKNKKLDIKRELTLLLVYICFIVVARYTFFPFSKIDGKIQPLVFDYENFLNFKINLVPLVHLFDYPKLKDAVLNLIGNFTMFIPVGIIFPVVFKKLNTQ